MDRNNTRPQFGRQSKSSLVKITLNETKIDYKYVELLKQYITERGKILPRRITGVTARQQRILTKAIKRARCIALLPFESREG